MITERQIKSFKRYCREPIENIKGYHEAVSSREPYDCHHRNELTFSEKELILMNMYYHRPASELVFIERSVHRGSNKLHKECHKVYVHRVSTRNPNWKGDSANDSAKYRRALKLFKAGLISEEELAPLRKLSQKETKERHILKMRDKGAC